MERFPTGADQPIIPAHLQNDFVTFFRQDTPEHDGEARVIFNQQDSRSIVHRSTRGRTIPKVVPRCTCVWYCSAPPCFSTSRAAIDNPRPVPLLLVEKNGSNRRFSTSGEMPWPVSATSRMITLTV